MLFIATCTDKPNSQALRLETRPKHLAYLKDMGARVRAGGALLTQDQKSVVGSLLILQGENEAEILELLAADPYAHVGLFASVEVRPWRQAVGIPLA